MRQVDCKIYIFKRLKEKYYNRYTDYLMSKAADLGCKWLFGIAKKIKNEDLRKMYIDAMIHEAVKVAENWLNEYCKNMFGV